MKPDVVSVLQVQQANFLFHIAFHIQKRKLACRTLYKGSTGVQNDVTTEECLTQATIRDLLSLQQSYLS
jgi:hypothetical protein